MEIGSRIHVGLMRVLRQISKGTSVCGGIVKWSADTSSLLMELSSGNPLTVQQRTHLAELAPLLSAFLNTIGETAFPNYFLPLLGELSRKADPPPNVPKPKKKSEFH